jgi:ECF transporter S component (folate family)
MKNKAFKSVRILTLAAMLTALSVVIGIVCKSFLNFGGGLFRITFENLPIILSGILMGPVVGGIVGAASDLISYLLSPQIFPPNLIVTAGAVAVGVASGAMYRILGKSGESVKIALSGGVAHALGSMIIKPIGLYQFYGLAVLWRVPMYLVIAPVEILLLCWLFERKSVKQLFDSVIKAEPKRRRRSKEERRSGWYVHRPPGKRLTADRRHSVRRANSDSVYTSVVYRSLTARPCRCNGLHLLVHSHDFIE